MKLSLITEDTQSIYSGYILPLEHAGRIFSADEIAKKLADAARLGKTGKVWVTNDLDYSKLYATGEMASPDQSEQTAAALDNTILFIGVIQEFRSTRGLVPDPSQKVDLGYGSGEELKHRGATWATSLYTGTGSPQAYWTPADELGPVVNVYLCLNAQYYGHECTVSKLDNVATVVNEILGMPYWPDLINGVGEISVQDKQLS